MPSSLESYIQAAREKNKSDESIKQTLVAAGWDEQQVNKALGIKDDDLPPPPPPNGKVTKEIPHVGMWTGFLYILFFISLYVLATAIGILFHNWVDADIPDVANLSMTRYTDDNALVRGAIAAVVVSYPIFLTLALILKKQLAKQPLVRNLRSRKILIYITLIGTFLIMLGHVIATIYGFLGGTLTANSVGHLGVTFLIAGAIFAYFINEVKNDRKTA